MASTKILVILLSGIGAIGLSLVARRFVLKLSPASKLVDRPNARSLHHAPVPRVGGLAVVAIALAALFSASGFSQAAIGMALVPLFFVSFLDDVFGVTPMVRLWVHVAAAGVVVLTISPPHIGFALLAIPTMVWMANLFNFMDGADGLAGGMAAIGFGALGMAAPEGSALAISCFAITGASLGFLVLNFAPASVFLGDAGSIPLGFLAAAMGYLGFVEQQWPFWFPALVFAPFIIDATLTLAKRKMNGETVLAAHRDHLYQRLILSGWSHRKLALTAYAVMLATSAASIVALRMPRSWQLAIAGSALLGMAALFVAAERHLAAKRKGVNN